MPVLRAGPSLLRAPASGRDADRWHRASIRDVIFEAYGVETRDAEEALRASCRETPTRAVAEAAARRYDAPSLPPSPNVAVGADPAIDRFFGASDRASVADHAKTERGHEQERRSLARRLGIDPYTMQPALASKLADMAWVSYVGGALRDALLPPAALERQALPGSGTARALVYDTPRGLSQKNVERSVRSAREGARAVEAHVSPVQIAPPVLGQVAAGTAPRRGSQPRSGDQALPARRWHPGRSQRAGPVVDLPKDLVVRSKAASPSRRPTRRDSARVRSKSPPPRARL